MPSRSLCALRGSFFALRHAMVLGRESSRVLALKYSWHDGVTVVVPPPLGKAIASSEGPS